MFSVVLFWTSFYAHHESKSTLVDKTNHKKTLLRKKCALFSDDISIDSRSKCWYFIFALLLLMVTSVLVRTHVYTRNKFMCLNLNLFQINSDDPWAIYEAFSQEFSRKLTQFQSINLSAKFLAFAKPEIFNVNRVGWWLCHFTFHSSFDAFLLRFTLIFHVFHSKVTFHDTYHGW